MKSAVQNKVPAPAHRPVPGQKGFGVIAALVVLVLLAGFAAALTRISVAQQTMATQDMLSAHAWMAAKAGTEWGVFQALKGSWIGPGGASLCSTPQSRTLDLSAEAGMYVTVRCRAATYNEGESAPGVVNTVTILDITATACPSASGCPNNAMAVQPTYIERTRQVQVQR